MSGVKGQYLYYFAQPINHIFLPSPTPTAECYFCTKCLEIRRGMVRVTLVYLPENYIEM